jgi:hypothetical protein
MKFDSLLVSKIISVVFHPLLMPTYGLFIIFNSGTHFDLIPVEGQRLIYIMVFLSTVVIPVSIIPFLINLKVVSNFSLEKGRERFVPLLITTFSFFFAYQLISKLSHSLVHFIEMMLLASSILVFVCFLISLRWKISAHLIGIGGLFGAMYFFAVFYVANISLVIAGLCLSSGFVAYARLHLGAHNPAQVYAGFFAGLFGMLAVLAVGV